jgi:hypothetical protein
VLARVQANSEPERRVLNFSAFARAAHPWLVLSVTAAAACLLIAMTVLIYRDLRDDKSHQQTAAVPAIAQQSGGPPPQETPKGVGGSVGTTEKQNSEATPNPRQSQERVANKEINRAPEAVQSRVRRDHMTDSARTLRADVIEGQRAKEQLELALYIASSKLNQAERAVSHVSQDDEPHQNREPDEHRMDR